MPQEIEEALISDPFALLSRDSASGPSALSKQTRLQNLLKALMEMPYLAEYMTDSRVAAGLRSGLDSSRDTPLSSLTVIRNECPATPAVAPEQAPRATELPSTRLPPPTEPTVSVTPPAPRASATSSLSSASTKSQSPSPVLRRSIRRGAGST